MNFSWASETDWTVGRELNTHLKAVAGAMDKALSAPPLSNIDLDIAYCPLLMGQDDIGGYPARSRRSIINRAVYVAPKLDDAAFVSSNANKKRKITADGLLEAIIYLRRFAVGDDVIRAFCAAVQTAGRWASANSNAKLDPPASHV